MDDRGTCTDQLQPLLHDRATFSCHSATNSPLSPSCDSAGGLGAAAPGESSGTRCMEFTAEDGHDIEQGLVMVADADAHQGEGNAKEHLDSTVAHQGEGNEQEHLDLRMGWLRSPTPAGADTSVQELARVEQVGLCWASNSDDSSDIDCVSFCGETRSICGSIESESGLGMQHREQIDMEHAVLLPAGTSCSRSRGTGSVSGRLQGNRWKLNRRENRRDSSMHGKESQSTCEES